MSGRWFYKRKGRTFGPVTTLEVLFLAESGQLSPQDEVWQEGADPAGASAVESVLVGRKQSQVPPPGPIRTPAQQGTGQAQPAPVASKPGGKGGPARKTPAAPGGAAGPSPPQPPAAPVPDWLGDVAAAEQEAASPPPAQAPAAQTGKLPDWLADSHGPAEEEINVELVEVVPPPPQAPPSPRRPARPAPEPEILDVIPLADDEEP